MSSLSARRLTAAVIFLVVGAVLAVFWLAPSADAAVSRGAERAATPGAATAVSSSARRPSPRIRNRKVKKAPRALAAARGERRAQSSRPRRRVQRRRMGTTEG